MSKKSHRKHAEGKGRYFGGIEYLVRDRDQRTNVPVLVREGRNLLRVSHKNPFLQDAGHCFMLYQLFLCCVLEYKSKVLQWRQLQLNVLVFFAFLMKGVLNTYIHSVGGRDGMGFTVGMVSPLL